MVLKTSKLFPLGQKLVNDEHTPYNRQIQSSWNHIIISLDMQLLIELKTFTQFYSKWWKGTIVIMDRCWIHVLQKFQTEEPKYCYQLGLVSYSIWLHCALATLTLPWQLKHDCLIFFFFHWVYKTRVTNWHLPGSC